MPLTLTVLCEMKPLSKEAFPDHCKDLPCVSLAQHRSLCDDSHACVNYGSLKGPFCTDDAADWYLEILMMEQWSPAVWEPKSLQTFFCLLISHQLQTSIADPSLRLSDKTFEMYRLCRVNINQPKVRIFIRWHLTPIPEIAPICCTLMPMLIYLENAWLMTSFHYVAVKAHLTSSTMESVIQGKLTPCSQTPLNSIWPRILSLLYPLEQNLWIVLKLEHVYS